MTYDVDNRLDTYTQIVGTKTTTQNNLYNGNGQRVQKSEGDNTINYFYQGDKVLYTTNSNGDKTSHNFIGLEGNTISTIRYNLSGFEYYIYNKDIKGSTSNIVDNNGNAKISYTYSDFGETKEVGDTTFYNEICYTGGIYDESTSLYYLNARYYNPEDARFLTQDTYRGESNNPSSLHLYAYCANNPINYVDPSGHAIETTLDLINLSFSTLQLVSSPNMGNFFNFAWDVGATIIPFLPGSYVKTIAQKTIKGIDGKKTINAMIATNKNDLRKTNKLIITSYSKSKNILKGATFIERHHIIEKRFAPLFSITQGRFPTVIIGHSLHTLITTRWNYIPHFRKGVTGPDGRQIWDEKTYYKKTVNKSRLKNAVNYVYKDMPCLREIGLKQIQRYWK